MTATYVTFAIAMAILAGSAVIYARRWVKVLSTVLFVGLIIAAPSIYYDTLSRPKLLTDEVRNDEQAEILAFAVQEGVAVYYWLQLPGLNEPRYYYEAWSEQARKRAQAMYREKGKDENATLIIPYPFQPSLNEDENLTIHALPQPKPPTKPEPPRGREFKI